MKIFFSIKFRGIPFIALALIASYLFIMPIGVHAQTLLRTIKSSGVLKIGTEGTYPPFSYHDDSGVLTGFDVEIARLVAQRLGVKAEFIEGKWDGLIAGVDAKRYDIVANEVTITDARKAKYDFSIPYIISKAVLLVQEGNTSIKTFSDLKGKKSAQSLSSNFARLATDSGATVLAVEGFNQAIDVLLAGRVDATINDSLSYFDFKKKKPAAKIMIVDTVKDSDKQGLLIRKGNPDLLQAINTALTELIKDGTFLQISTKYFGADVLK